MHVRLLWAQMLKHRNMNWCDGCCYGVHGCKGQCTTVDRYECNQPPWTSHVAKGNTHTPKQPTCQSCMQANGYGFQSIRHMCARSAYISAHICTHTSRLACPCMAITTCLTKGHAFYKDGSYSHTHTHTCTCSDAGNPTSSIQNAEFKPLHRNLALSLVV